MKPEKELKAQEVFDTTDFTKEDEQLYKLLFSELDKEAEMDIKPGFSANVIKAVAKNRRKEALSENLLFGFAIVGVLILTVLAASFAKTALGSAQNMLQNSPLAPALLFTGLLILFQFVDKKYLKSQRIKRRLSHKQASGPMP